MRSNRSGPDALLEAAIDTSVSTKAVRPDEFERTICDSTDQEKAIAHLVDSRLLEMARATFVQAAKFCWIARKQAVVKEGKSMRRNTGG